jgi:uncharacterized protein YndB with AHSA1/START domain
MSRVGSCLAAVVWLAAGTAWAAPNDIVDQDLAERSADIHWPAGFAPPAVDMFSHNEITIHAQCQAVWSTLLAAPAWPDWYPNSHNVQINGGSARLTPHAAFDWETFDHHIHSVVAEFEPATRLAWFGDGPGVHAYHTWLLQPVGGDCHVVTEEETVGPAARAGRTTNPGALHRGHDLWLDRLRDTVEKSGRQG